MGFKITRDYIKDKDEKGAVGIESSDDYRNGEIKVRLLDDDNNVYYHAFVDDVDHSCELLFDWGMSYAGTTALDLDLKAFKEHCGNPRHERLISKCGKWFSYMG